ncbi:MAG: heavy metal translocating P-type ATPase [Candidatus Hodarchaeales archaeon]
MSKIKRYKLSGLSCPSCSLKIENELKKTYKDSDFSINFVTKELVTNYSSPEDLGKLIDRVEPGVQITDSTQTESQHDKRKLIFIIMSFFILFGGMLVQKELHSVQLLILDMDFYIFGVAYVLVGYEVLIKALRGIKRIDLFNENTLMAIATIGAFMIHELPEAVAVMLFFSIGDYLQNRSIDSSKRSIKELIDIRPETANLIINGQIQTVSPEQIKKGDTVVIRPGEKIPVDGIVVKGSSFLDTSALTGESRPRHIKTDDEVLSGVINLTSLLHVKTTKIYTESTASKILELIENSASRKASIEKFMTKFARVYTPGVVLVAILIAILPPLLIPGELLSTWVYRSLVILVISCPCALVVSIPLSYFAGIGEASRQGILIKGANYLEALSQSSIVMFDKTGTLTKGDFKVVKIVESNGFGQSEILYYAALAEKHSSHPIARSILEAYGKEINISVESYEEIHAAGIKTTINGQEILVGNDRLLHIEDIEHDCKEIDETQVHVVVDKKYAGYMIISDEIKVESFETIKNLNRLNVEEIYLLTGDNKKVADSVAREIGIDPSRVFSELLPDQKVEIVEKVLENKSKGSLIFIGDGINDAPVLARADIGMSMGSLGSDAAIEASDVVLMNDNPILVPRSIELSRRTKTIIWQNIVFAFFVKIIFITLGGFGLVSMWVAVFADVGVAILTILNSLRLLTSSKSC